MSSHSKNTPEPSAEEAAITAAESVLADHSAWTAIAVPRWKRLVKAMYSAGILDVVGRDWVSFDEDAFHFGDLSFAQIEKLIQIFERYEVGGSRAAAWPGAARLPLDFAPVPPTRPSTTLADAHHTGVSR